MRLKLNSAKVKFENETEVCNVGKSKQCDEQLKELGENLWMICVSFCISCNPQKYSFDKLYPIKGNLLDSEVNAGGGQFDTTSEMNEGVP